MGVDPQNPEEILREICKSICQKSSPLCQVEHYAKSKSQLHDQAIKEAIFFPSKLC